MLCGISRLLKTGGQSRYGRKTWYMMGWYPRKNLQEQSIDWKTKCMHSSWDRTEGKRLPQVSTPTNGNRIFMVNMSKVVFVNFLQTLKENTPPKNTASLYSNIKLKMCELLSSPMMQIVYKCVSFYFKREKHKATFPWKMLNWGQTFFPGENWPTTLITHFPILYKSLTPICAESQLQ